MLKLFAVRDVKADAFSSIVALPTAGLAARGFVDACAQQGPIRQYPEDYTLYELGSFDPMTGEVKGLIVPKYIMSAVEAIATLRKEDARQTLIPGTEPKVDGRKVEEILP